MLFIIILLFVTGASKKLYNNGKSLYNKIELFSNIFEKIQKDYIEEKNSQELVENAINGMISNLDPHTSYMNAEYFNKWKQNFEGYFGIGIYYDIIRDKITIMSVIEGGPSDKVGLRVGDRIIAIDDQSAVGVKRDNITLMLMGSKGTKVKVTIERYGWSKPRNFIITREDVHIKSIPYAFFLRPGLGYINIARFSSTTDKEIKNILEEFTNKDLKHLILDLRKNGGGYLETAVGVLDNFLPSGRRIVYTKGRIQNSFREFFSSNGSTYLSIPIIVLIDRTSASASEIVAGALQDWDRALIIGETSFGKGMVQSQYKFKDGSALLMTTAQYYTPSGRLIQRSYNDKTFERYYNEIMVDSIREKIEKDSNRPVYKTMILGRKVYGGGGITPDIFFTVQNDTMSKIVKEMVYFSKQLFFTFVENHIKHHPELEKDFTNFIRNYNPSWSTLQLFLKYIRKLGFKITNKDFIRHKQEIQFVLKQYIAGEIWGEEVRYKILILKDHQLLEAIKYLPQAETLLAKAYSHK
jgi:carboxyl-terminal processing protease